MTLVRFCMGLLAGRSAAYDSAAPVAMRRLWVA